MGLQREAMAADNVNVLLESFKHLVGTASMESLHTL
jgi:hypothetical protein